MKVKVAVPYANHGEVSFITRQGLADLVKCKDFETTIYMTQGSNIPRARNGGVNNESSVLRRQKIKGFDYILFVDSDIGFRAKHLLQLLEHDVDVVSGAYQKRECLDRICAGDWDIAPGTVLNEKCLPWDTGGLKKVKWAGAGFFLVKSSVFERMDYPWFRCEAVEYLNESEEECSSLTSDDIGFCLKAAEAGIDIHVDCSCKVEHLCRRIGGVVVNLPTDTKVGILSEEMGKLEIDMYRTALKVEAANNSGVNASESHRMLDSMRALKSTYLHEIDILEKSRMS